MDPFHYSSYAQEVIFASGALGQIGDAVARRGWRRLLLCTSPSQQAAGHPTTLAAALGERLVAVYGGVQPHVPAAQVDEATALAAAQWVDAVIGLGGGSPIGLAKAVSHARGVAVIAIPTTYAGSEMTPVFGVTRTVDGITRKITTTDPQVAPQLVVYDPLLTYTLPPDLTAATGINALAHCVEAVYSVTRNPLSTAAALAGVQLIGPALPRCVADGGDTAARSAMLAGAHLAGRALASVTMGLHHGICHVLGGTAGVPHGLANSIMLPHVMRFNEAAAAPALAEVAGALGVAGGGQSVTARAAAATEAVAALVARLGLPQRLREVGVAATDLPALADLAFASRTVHSNPRPITDVVLLLELLQTAW